MRFGVLEEVAGSGVVRGQRERKPDRRMQTNKRGPSKVKVQVQVGVDCPVGTVLYRIEPWLQDRAVNMRKIRVVWRIDWWFRAG